MKYKKIALPRLNNLKPSIESTTLKLAEEMGEFAQVVGKFRNLNGEQNDISQGEIINKLCEELLDISQVAVSLMFILEEEHGVNIEERVEEHIRKLERKGYIKSDL